MARTNLTEGRKQDFLYSLRQIGGRGGNKALRTQLGWGEEFYSRVQSQLVIEGKIRPGPGRGGSVSIVEESVTDISEPSQSPVLPVYEQVIFAYEATNRCKVDRDQRV